MAKSEDATRFEAMADAVKARDKAIREARQTRDATVKPFLQAVRDAHADAKRLVAAAKGKLKAARAEADKLLTEAADAATADCRAWLEALEG